VYAVCASILRNRQEAEDAAQQVFVSALRALRGGTVPRDAGAWLTTIARHESWARARRRTPAPLQSELPDRSQEDPAAEVVRRAELADAWRGIAELPPTQQKAFLLREVRGLGYDELAADLRLSRASVRSLLRRARHTLRMRLEQGAAALSGAQWLSMLARLSGDTSSPAFSSATRTAAVGLGALALTGGAVVAPRPTHHPVRPDPVARAAAIVRKAPVRSRVTAAIALRPVARAVSAVHRRRSTTMVDSRRGRSGGDGGGGAGSSHDGSGGSVDGGPGPSGPTEGVSGGSSGPSDVSGSGGPAPVLSSSGSDGGGTSSGDGSGSSSGSGGTDGPSDSGSRDGGS
jgi:RNA polymerase sigma-70 factor (ECF subfamily)